jgi:phosphomethylpyrimidine synthase
MKITQEVRDYAARQGLIETDALTAGMEEQSRRFREGGAELYVNEPARAE